MGDGYNFKALKKGILELSRASDWEVAKKEWRLIGITQADEPETCLCGHTPIIDLCTIENSITGREVDVGNVCVKNFLGLRSDIIFQAIKRIRQDITKSLNADATTFFYERRVISEWEYNFQQNTMRKKKFTPAQLDKRVSINRTVLDAIRRRGLV